MECPICGEKGFEGGAYCFNCGASLVEQTAKMPSVQASSANQSDAPAPAEPVKPEPVAEDVTIPAAPFSAPVSNALGGEFSWFEDSGMSLPEKTFVDSSRVGPQVTPPPYYAPYPMAPGAALPVRRGPKHPGLWLLFTLFLCLLIVAIIVGGSFAGAYYFARQYSSVSSQSSSTVTPQPSQNNGITKAEADSVYAQVMGQSPFFADSLRTQSPAGWNDYKGDVGDCKIEADGLHVRIKQANNIYYCFSNHGVLTNFAFQVDMNMLTGDGGGLLLRGNDDSSGFYFFSIGPDGHYDISLMANGNWGTDFDSATSDSLIPGYNHKNRLTVIAQGSNLYIYVNKVFLTGIQDATYSYGYLGLAAVSQTATDDVVFTDAKTWELPG